MRKALPLLVALLVLPALAMAQTEWEFQNTLPDDASIGGIHGTAFDMNGNIWSGPYYSIVPEEGQRINPVYCFKPDGTACDDVDFIYGSMTADTLLRFGPITGMATDHEGNILISSHGFRTSADGNPWNSSRAFVHRIDANTGEGLGVGEITVMRTETASQAFHIAADEFGDIYYSTVFPGEPIRVMDSDFEFQLNVSDNRLGFARAIAVNREGTRVYQPSNFGTEIIVGSDTLVLGGRVEVHGGDVFDGFNVLDTLSLIGMDPGAGAVCPETGVVYFPASGSGNNPEGDPDLWQPLTIYGLYPDADGEYNVVDQLTWDQSGHDTEDGPFNPIYRAMGISQDGLSLAVGGFAAAAPVQLFTREELLDPSTVSPPPVTDTEWEFQNTLPEDGSVGGIHGTAFDMNGNIWSGPYYSIVPEEGQRINPVYCFKPDGTACDDVDFIYGSMTADTLLRFGPITGMATDHEGNILISSHGFRTSAEGNPWNSSRAFVHRIDPNTGDGLGVGEITVMRTETASQAFHIAADEFGDIYYSTVFPGEPIRVMDADFEFQLNVSDNRLGFARAIAVNREGTRVYQPSNFGTELITGTDTLVVGGRVEVHGGDVFDGFNVLDTLTLIGLDPGAGAVCPVSGVAYFPASGSGNNPEGDPDLWEPLNIYGVLEDARGDFWEVDVLTWHQADPADPFNPIYRAMGISQDGLSLAVGGFAAAAPVQLFTREFIPEFATSVEDEPSVTDLPGGFQLDQNYPNPFNPATTIRYTIPSNMEVRIDVYNVAGQRVATLVNERQEAGVHTATFDGTRMASGVYLYRITAGNFVETRKMTLIK